MIILGLNQGVEGAQDIYQVLKGDLYTPSKNYLKEITGHRVDNTIELLTLISDTAAGMKVASMLKAAKAARLAKAAKAGGKLSGEMYKLEEALSKAKGVGGKAAAAARKAVRMARRELRHARKITGKLVKKWKPERLMPDRLMTAVRREFDMCCREADRLLNPNGMRRQLCVEGGPPLPDGVGGSLWNEMDATGKPSVLERKVGSGAKKPKGNVGGAAGKDAVKSAAENGTSRLPVPEEVTAKNGLRYKSNSKHTPGAAGCRPNAGIEPRNSLELFENSVPSSKKVGARFAFDEKTEILYRFFNDGNGTWHWSGSTNQGINSIPSGDIPPDIKRYFGLKMKG